MAGHNSQRSGINALLIYHTVSIHPSLTVEIVDRCHQMLVSLILSITGKCLMHAAIPSFWIVFTRTDPYGQLSPDQNQRYGYL